MPNTYNKPTVQAFVDKIEQLKKLEERGLKIENQFGQEHPSIVRQVSIEVYSSVIEMIEEHFKLNEEAPKPRKRGGGRTRKATAEVAASTKE